MNHSSSAKELEFPPEACVEAATAWKDVPPSIWVKINQSVAKYQPVNLGQGFPDFAPPAHVLGHLAAVADTAGDKNKLLHQYTRSMGHERLVKALAQLYTKFHTCPTVNVDSNTFLSGHRLDPMKNVLISVGAYGCLFAAFTALLNPDDECIIIEPNFDCYAPMIREARAIPVYVQLTPNSENSSAADWQLDWKQLESVVTKKTRALVLNTPHNPLGKVFTLSELQCLASFCIKHNLTCISDEVYEWQVFRPMDHVKIASLPGMWSRTVTIGSAGKTFSITGWKLGWTIGPSSLIQAMQSQQQNTVYTCPTPLQEAVARSLEDELFFLEHDTENCYLLSLRDELRTKADQMVRCLAEAGLRPIKPQSGYFLISDCSGLGKGDDFATNDWLMQHKRISGIPQSVFYNTPESKAMGRKYIRWCYGKEQATLDEAFLILNRLQQN